jgi:hypothetical protein
MEQPGELGGDQRVGTAVHGLSELSIQLLGSATMALKFFDRQAEQKKE